MGGFRRGSAAPLYRPGQRAAIRARNALPRFLQGKHGVPVYCTSVLTLARAVMPSCYNILFERFPFTSFHPYFPSRFFLLSLFCPLNILFYPLFWSSCLFLFLKCFFHSKSSTLFIYLRLSFCFVFMILLCVVYFSFCICFHYIFFRFPHFFFFSFFPFSLFYISVS